MQHDHVLKKLKFDLLTPSPGSENWGPVGVSGQNICFHAAAFRESLLLGMQHNHVLEKLKFDLLTHP